MTALYIASKDLKQLARDRRAAIILLLMPLLLMFVLGISLGEGFGQKPDERLRISLVDLDKGDVPLHAAAKEVTAGFVFMPLPCNGFANTLGGLGLMRIAQEGRFPFEPWAKVILKDLAETAEIRVEIVPDLETARKLCNEGQRSAIIVFGPNFSKQVNACSFLTEGINPFYRDGVLLPMLDAQIIRDPTQSAAGSIIEQVAQVSLLRVVLPWMIGRAFEKLSDPSFLSILASEAKIPRFLLTDDFKVQMGTGIKVALRKLFAKYNLTGKTWAALTKSDPRFNTGSEVSEHKEEGQGFLNRGALRYQILVPSNIVMFSFFLVLTAGWLFVIERKNGTWKRLRLAPVTSLSLMIGKVLPCLTISIAQGLFLLLMGKVLFGLSWGTQPAMLLVLVIATSWAATGLAILVASLAKTEAQVAIYGTLLSLGLAGISGCLMPRELMPETMKQWTLLTPHAWALDGYRQLLLNPMPSLSTVWLAAAILFGFGTIFLLTSFKNISGQSGMN